MEHDELVGAGPVLRQSVYFAFTRCLPHSLIGQLETDRTASRKIGVPFWNFFSGREGSNTSEYACLALSFS